MFSFNYNPADIIEEPRDAAFGGIALGNYEAAKNVEFLKRNKIKFVLSAVPAIIAKVSDYPALGITQKVVDCMDDPSFDMTPFLEQAADFIDQGVKKGGVLVHCAAGISRSTTCLVAYYIKHRGMGVEQALALIRKKRPIASPNMGFMSQLSAFEKRMKK